MKFTWTSFKKAKAARTIGSFIEVDLPLLGIEGLRSKVDTGAFSGALHATRIREVKSPDGIKLLRFAPLGSSKHTIEIDQYHKRRVKSSNGVAAWRYAIDSEVIFKGRRYPITITLTNRSRMKYPMLIGRNFLRLHGFLIDVSGDTE